MRITNCKINEHGTPTTITLSAYKNHKKIFEVIIGLANEKVNLNELLSKLQIQTNALNIQSIEWPLNDIIFTMCTITDFKKTANNLLNNLQIVLIQPPKIITDKQIPQESISKFHADELFGGHYGKKKLYAKLKPHYYWRNMSKDISIFINNCHSCKLSKPGKKTREELVVTETPLNPFDIVQIDTIGPMQKSNSGNQYAITIIDEMSKWLVIIATQTKTANEVAKAIFEKFILIYGPMREIKTDMGTEYRNSVISELCQLLKLNKSFSTVYHHETVGAIERSHRA